MAIVALMDTAHEVVLPPAMDHGTQRAVLAALLANVGVATAKVVGFVMTGSAALAAEALHSFADTGNEVLLFFGGHRSRRPATEEHPFGYGGELYFWGFVVALVLFVLGSLFSLAEGYRRLQNPGPVHDTGWALGIVVVSAIFEGLSLRNARRQANQVRWGDPWWRFIHRTKNPQLLVVLVEDFGALIGLSTAVVGLSVSFITDNPFYDALASVFIGVLLGAIAIAIALATEMKSLLIGEAAGPHRLTRIYGALENCEHVVAVQSLRTLHLGPRDLLVVAGVELDVDTAADSVSVSEHAEAAVRHALPIATYIVIDVCRPSDARDSTRRDSTDALEKPTRRPPAPSC